MNETVLTAEGNTIVPVAREEWEAELRGAPAVMKTRLAFMTPDHHRVRRFVVAEIPRRGRAITIDEIAGALSMKRERVETIIGELERGLFFLVGGQAPRLSGHVSWAFPVTADETPHALAFSTGERCYAA